MWIITIQDYKHTKLMWMEIHMYSVKGKSQAGKMSQTYNDNIKRPKLQDILLGILKTYAFCRKLQQRALGSGESTAGVM